MADIRPKIFWAGLFRTRCFSRPSCLDRLHSHVSCNRSAFRDGLLPTFTDKGGWLNTISISSAFSVTFRDAHTKLSHPHSILQSLQNPTIHITPSISIAMCHQVIQILECGHNKASKTVLCKQPTSICGGVFLKQELESIGGLCVSCQRAAELRRTKRAKATRTRDEGYESV